MFSYNLYRCCLDYHSNLTEVYRRGSKDVKCIHPSQNDDLWRKAKKMRRMVENDCEDVRDFKYGNSLSLSLSLSLKIPAQSYKIIIETISVVSVNPKN